MLNLITLTDPRSTVAEAYQSLRTNIEFSGLQKELRTILITSVDSGADKSTALANLAVVMAQAGDRVIILDGDLRRPQQPEIFGLPNQRGLSTWLSEPGAAPLQQTSLDNLSLVTAGPSPANPVAMLGTRNLERVLNDLRSQADIVLIDAPPVLAVTDAALWASKVDGVVLLLSAGATKRDQAQRAKAVLEKVQARIVGAVLLNADRDVAIEGYGE